VCGCLYLSIRAGILNGKSRNGNSYGTAFPLRLSRIHYVVLVSTVRNLPHGNLKSYYLLNKALETVETANAAFKTVAHRFRGVLVLYLGLDVHEDEARNLEKGNEERP